ncbi:hypothetical protein [Streptomyces rubellomurinus]|uniref:Tryptophan 2,3-dioxygenase n=1 Tax=Streptomyces sp. Y1 TaxID=3238634 RepID=A0AB39TKZ1_9ACTN|nr:hypothetical protein [Streptomyces rubellomurinus]
MSGAHREAATPTAPAAAAAAAALGEELADWCRTGTERTFPYTALLAHLRSVGKHFLAPDLLDRLAACRTRHRADLLAAGPEEAPGSFLGRFLDVVLDKYDDHYDYPSYTALELLRRPPSGDWRKLRYRRDRLVLLLLADLVDFEQRALDGHPEHPVEMLPDARVLDKRRRLAVRVMEPAALRVLAPGTVDPGTVAATPGRTAPTLLADAVRDTLSDEERLTLAASVQPVYVLHDEYLFLRVLQSFEATFTFMSGALACAVRQLHGEEPGEAAPAVAAVADVLKESLPLFSLLATMQPESFRIFRQFTDGASAIQSEGYKTFESFCSTPLRARLDSAAFTSVPRVRAAVLEGRETVQGTWHDVADSGWLKEADATAVRAAATQLESVHQRWKQTHYRLAVRMIGERTGTGATEGVPYLEAVIANRLFPSLVRETTAA